MSEYIDREKTQAYLYNNMMWYDPEGYITEDSEKDKALWSLVNGVPTADVIEREKIDKAIKEMKLEYYNLDSCENRLIASYWIEKSIKILKRNIGE